MKQEMEMQCMFITYYKFYFKIQHIHLYLYFRAVEAFPDTGLLQVKNPKASDSEQPKSFTFDAVFGPNVEQKHIYNTCAAGVIDSVLNGYNGTIFAYGQVSFIITSNDCF